MEFKFFEGVPAEIYGYALVLTKKLANISSDGQRHSDLIEVKTCRFCIQLSFCLR